MFPLPPGRFHFFYDKIMATKYEIVIVRIYENRLYVIALLAAIFLLIAPAIGLAAEINGACRSDAGGYCMNLAAAAHTQTAGALDFLGNPKDIGTLIANLYYFGLGVVAVAAFIMMVFGGFTYMTAGDNPGRIKEGTSYIKNALFGLLIALISWLILYTINPDLIKNLNVTIPKISTAPMTASCNASQQCVIGGGGAACSSNLDCVGGGGTQYLWVNEGLNQTCRNTAAWRKRMLRVFWH
jgi:hypothetical protein